MENFLESIRLSVASENWFGALFICLAMPDICATLEHENPSKYEVGKRYKDWFDRYLKKTYAPDSLAEMLEAGGSLTNMSNQEFQEYVALLKRMPPDPRMHQWAFTSEDCYLFRCKCLHQGLPEKMSQDRIYFSPLTSGATIHQVVNGGKYTISIAHFCFDMCRAVEQWNRDTQSDIDIQRRKQSLLVIE